MNIERIIQSIAETTYSDYASEFGNDSRMSALNDKPIIVMSQHMSDLLYKHSRIEKAAEDAGFDLVHYDEYVVDHETGKAWRTAADSFMWTASVAWTDGGEMLTPDDDIEEWIEWARNAPSCCITPSMKPMDELLEYGFVDMETDSETGWHPGQTDDSAKMYAEYREDHPDADVVFYMTENSMFYCRFTMLVRPTCTTVSYNGFSHDGQVFDAIAWLKTNRPDEYQVVVDNYEVESVIMDGAWVDTDAMGVDPDWVSWLTDWIEQETCIEWEHGEPFAVLY